MYHYVELNKNHTSNKFVEKAVDNGVRLRLTINDTQKIA